MANRTNSIDVLQILDGCTLSDTVVDEYITTANAVVTDVLGNDTDLGTTLKKAIEQWLAAHMIASTLWRTAAKEKIGEVWIEYTGKWSEGLKGTPYGQMVLDLDTTGKMSSLGKRAVKILAITSFE